MNAPSPVVKRTLLLMTLGALPLFTASSIAVWSASNALETAALERLTTLRDLQRAQAEVWMERQLVAIDGLANEPELAQALGQFTTGFHSGPRSRSYLRAQRHFGPKLKAFQARVGAADLVLLSMDGDVLYQEELDALDGKVDRGSTQVATAFREARSGTPTLTEFTIDADGNASAVLSAPVDRDGARLGVIALRVPAGELGAMVMPTNPTGLERTYLVRGGSTSASGIEQVDNTRGVPVWSAYAPIDVDGLDWVVVSEVEVAGVGAPVAALQTRMLWVGAWLSLALAGLALVLGRDPKAKVARPAAPADPQPTPAPPEASLGDIELELDTLLEDLRLVVGAVSSGDLSRRLEDAHVDGPMSDVVRAVNDLLGTLALPLGQITVSATNVSDVADEIRRGTEDLVLGSAEQMAAFDHLETTLDAVLQAHDSSSPSAESSQPTRSDNDQAWVTATEQMGDGPPPIGIACDTLRDLAFRMHLLAVNAGAVAARSHDEDEGSVAVADGVRDLADRSRDAVNQLERINRWSTELAETAEELALQLEEPLPTSSLAPQATQPLQSSSLEVARQALSELGGTLHASANHADTSSMRSRRLTHRAQELRRAAGHFRVSDRTAVLHQLPVPSQTGPHEVPTPTLKLAVGGGASDPGPTTESFEERFASKPHSG